MEAQDTSIDVLVIGSCMTDLIAYTNRLPKVGETIHGHNFTIGFGGKGANQCVAATKLGAKTALVAKLGNDTFGSNYLNNLNALKVDTSNVKIVNNSSGIAQISVSDTGENTIIIVAGANNDLTAVDVEEAEPMIERAKVVLFQFETPLNTTLKALEICSKYSCKTIVNGAPGVANLDPKLFRLCDIFCVNETEAELICGSKMKNIVDDAKNAACKLKSMGVKLPVITIGDRGVVFLPQDGDVPVHLDVEHVRAVDTTGAGDAFVGAMAYFLAMFDSNKLTMHGILKRSCEIARYSVQKLGTQTSFPHKADLPSSLFNSIEVE